MRALPWLILAAGAAGLFFLYKKLAGGTPAAVAAAAARAAWLVKWHQSCDGAGTPCEARIAAATAAGATSSGGGWLPSAAGAVNDDGTPDCGSCHVPVAPLPSVQYGSCPDRLSCAGEPQGGYTGPPYTPVMPSTGPLTPPCRPGGGIGFQGTGCQ